MPGGKVSTRLTFLRGFRRLRLFERWVLGKVAYLCGAIFLLYSFYVALEVVGRRYFGIYTGIADEIGAYTLAIGGSLAFAYTLLAGGHVRIDIVFGYLPDRARPWFDMVATASMAIFAWTVAFYVFNMTAHSYRIGATGHSLIQMPQWIIQAFVFIGYLLLGIFSLTSTISHIIKGLKPEEWNDPALGYAREKQR